MTSRREFVEGAALSALGFALPVASQPPKPRSSVAPHTATTAGQAPPPHGFVNVLRAPDVVVVHLANAIVTATPANEGRFTTAQGVTVQTTLHDRALTVQLASPRDAVKRVMMRWRASLADTRLVLGDAWERGYGDLEWRSWVPDRFMPWYVATHDGVRTHAYGVATGANAMCAWQVDAHGITLWADVRSGAAGVQLGDRELSVCTVLSRAGRDGESAFASLRAFCHAMCPSPRLPKTPVYGSNDWYWAYGNNSGDSARLDAKRIVELSPSGGNRPFTVIDDGWQPGRGKDKAGTGMWDRGNDKFGDMQRVAEDIRSAGSRAGIWVRPLQAFAEAPDSWRLPRDKNVLDPTVPDVRKKIMDDIARVHSWGYELIKHDYTTFELFGRWGFQMGSAMTRDGWTFQTGSARTTAEVISALYADIRTAAGDSVVIGCNTVSHLSAGHFEMCRTGDDTSGTEWPRTRKMGVNTLAFRAPQHGAFYVSDPDCAGITTAVPWSLNKQWLDILSRSGTMMFVSMATDALGTEQTRALREALARAAVPQPLGEPLDWMHSVYPSKWRLMGETREYDWIGADGAGLP